MLFQVGVKNKTKQNQRKQNQKQNLFCPALQAFIL